GRSEGQQDPFGRQSTEASNGMTREQDSQEPKQKAPSGAGLRACSCGHEQVNTGYFGGPEEIV
ncbi:MAG: hypothetical protein ACKOAJ_03465, partial [Actinomycetota bacterium]